MPPKSGLVIEHFSINRGSDWPWLEIQEAPENEKCARLPGQNANLPHCACFTHLPVALPPQRGTALIHTSRRKLGVLLLHLQLEVSLAPQPSGVWLQQQVSLYLPNFRSIATVPCFESNPSLSSCQRRELSDNFCFYNGSYDSLDGAAGHFS